METTVSTTHQAPDFDKSIADWISTYPENPYPSRDWVIGIADGKTIYRKIQCDGMHEFVAASEFIKSLGLSEVSALRGFDSVFAL
ncbi:MAG: hypothetical protein NVS3B3_18580 [Aquirhabdus sp.]